MRKLLRVAASSPVAVSLTACGSKDEGKKDDGKASESKANVVMVTDVGTVDDKSFNQGTQGGIKAYDEETGKKIEYIKLTKKSDNTYKEAIDQAVNKYKAKVIVTSDYLFEPSIYEERGTYSGVKFILIGGYPNDGAQENAKFKTAKNTVGIKYSENEASYTAGYTTVREGKTKFGFMDGITVPAVVNFGYGFVQGAQNAVKEVNAEIKIKYRYTGTFNPGVEIQLEAAPRCRNGTQVIFSCGGDIRDSVMTAAEVNKGLIIGVDADQSGENSAVITSTYKQLAVSVVKELETIDDGTFPGGENIVLGAEDDSVGPPMKTSKFEELAQKEYDALYTRIKEGKITIKTDEDFKDPTQIKASKVKLDYIR